MAKDSVFEQAGRLFFSRKRVRAMQERIRAAGISMGAEAVSGYLQINVLMLAVLISALLFFYGPAREGIGALAREAGGVPDPLVWFLILAVCLVAAYLSVFAVFSAYLVMKIEERRKRLEEVLPDYLTIVASNIKAGMTLDQAMWYSAKPEFGVLSSEIKSVVKEAFSGQSLEDSLDSLAERFDSRTFRRTINLVKQANATGGEMTDVLESTADDVRNSIIMKKEIAASLIMYEFFVLFAAAIGTPFLFAVTTKVIETFGRIYSQSGSLGLSQAPSSFGPLSAISIGGPVISSSDFFWFSIPTLFVTALVSSFIISVIGSGTRSSGMKYFPALLGASLLFYWLFISLMDSLFASIA